MSKTEKAKAPESDKKSEDSEQSLLTDLWELARIPLAFAAVAVIITWVVWFKTTEPCTDTITDECRPSGWGRYIDVDLLNKMFAHGGIAGGFGSIWSYVMLTRERRAREAAERQLAEERRQHAEERQQWLEEIRKLTAQITNGSQQANSDSA